MLNLKELEQKINDVDALEIFTTDLNGRSVTLQVHAGNAEGAKDTRIEIRSPDPSGNIYLQIATLIGMGLQGIREKIDCGDPDIGNLSDTKSASHLMDTNFLPRNMFEALVEAENSSFLKNFLGDPLYCQYMSLKTDEWENYRTFVTPREHKMNFHI